MKKYYAVIDTNVVVSSFIKEQSLPWWIVHLVEKDVITPLLHEEIVNEYREVLSRNKFGIDDSRIQSFLELFTKNGLFLEKTNTETLFSDRDDVVFYEIVLTGKKEKEEAYLVTGNKRHFPKVDYIVSPAEMIEILKGDGYSFSTCIDNENT